VGPGDYQRIVPLSELNSVGTCVNCSCLQSQLGGAIEELKSLQTIISLLQKENGRNYTDLVQSRCGKIDQLEVLENQVQGMGHGNGQSQEVNHTQKWNLAK
jgi:hypothetical protein